jgi:transposase
MLGFSGSLRVFVAVEACDMRKGFEGLSALVGSVLKEEVKSGALFAFSNRRRTRLKILYWDGSDLRDLSKRLEKATFAWPKPGDGIGGKLPFRAEALSMLRINRPATLARVCAHTRPRKKKILDKFGQKICVWMGETAFSKKYGNCRE